MSIQTMTWTELDHDERAEDAVGFCPATKEYWVEVGLAPAPVEVGPFASFAAAKARALEIIA